MRLYLDKRTIRMTGHLLMVAYLFVFLGWVVPHHTCDHTPKDLHSASSLGAPAEHHSIHNPDLCQLCKTHGELDFVVVHPTGLEFSADQSILLVRPITLPEQSPDHSLFSRAPPVVA